VLPASPVYEEVEVVECKKDQVCIPGMQFCMTQKNFKNMVGNTIKDRVYQEQLLNLLNSLK